MRKRHTMAAAALAATALLLAACGGDNSGSSSGSGSGSGSSSGKVGVILPDASTSPRWEANDRPLLKAAFDAAGLQSDIQNAERRQVEVRHDLRRHDQLRRQRPADRQPRLRLRHAPA